MLKFLKNERGQVSLDVLGAVAVGGAVILGMLLLIWYVGWVQPPRQCAAKAEVMNVPYSWQFDTKCMIQVDGQWMPLDAYYYNNAGGPGGN